jgi:glutaredoxin
MSGKTLLICLLLLASFGAWKHFKRPNSSPGGSLTTIADTRRMAGSMQDAVVVYGRDSCGYTRRMLNALQDSGIPVDYRNIDRSSDYQAFHDKYDGTGLAGERGYALPVVELDGRASMRPSPDAVATEYQTRRNN